MQQIKILMKRILNPTVFTSIISQIVILLTMFNINVDTQQVSIAVTAITTILITLGIMSNPDTKNKTFLDDIVFCKNCNKKSPHVLIKGDMVCKDCGTANK